MYRKIVVPLDGSEEAEKALPIAQNVLAPGGEVVLLHIIKPVSAGLGHEEGFIVFNDQLEDGERSTWLNYLEDVRNQNNGAASKTRCEVVISGSVAGGITQSASKEDADLIVMYTHDRKGLAKLIRGSIAEKVQRTVPIEVHVFNPWKLEEQTVPVERQEGVEQLDTLVSTLNKVALFQGLSEQQLNLVASLAQPKQVKTGDVLGEAGALGEYLFIVIHGEAQLSAPSAAGDITVRIAEPGEVFHVASLTRSAVLTTSGKALTDMELLAIPGTQLKKLCYKNPDLGLTVYTNFADLLVDRYNRSVSDIVLSSEIALWDADFLRGRVTPERLSS